LKPGIVRAYKDINMRHIDCAIV